MTKLIIILRNIIPVILFSAGFVILSMIFPVTMTHTQETLYNGIRLPAQWPPPVTEPSLEPMSPPYLKSPPKIIPVDVGRQLFVDDFLIEETTMIRTHHSPEPYEGNPVLSNEQQWEQKGNAPTAMPFSDGVWFDPQDNIFKMWYMAGYGEATAYATSEDGVRWLKPKLDVVPGTNIVHTWNRDSNTVVLDLYEQDKQKRFKLFQRHRSPKEGFGIHFSPDGIHWSDVVKWTGPQHDRTTVFFNPFRNVWVYSIKDYERGLIGRFRRYNEGPDPLTAAEWDEDNPPVFWVGADRLDPPYPGLGVEQPQLYNLDAMAYESLIIGLFNVWKGPTNDKRDGRPKLNQIFVGYSRDGFHWSRPLRRPFIAASEDTTAWNWGNVQSAGGCCTVIGDKLYFYYSGRTGMAVSNISTAECATGLAVLRRDGFTSMDAGEKEETLLTRTVTSGGNHLFVNSDMDLGELRVEILDRNGRVIPPFSKDNCIPIQVDCTIQEIQWRSAKNMSSAAGKDIRLRFYVRNGSLYSFWISPDKTGASHGYVAAGGPGFTGPKDTKGIDAYK